MHFVHQARALNGAYLKLWHYFEYVRRSSRYSPAAYLAPDSILQPTTTWMDPTVRWLNEWNPYRSDRLFLTAFNWRIVPEDCATPTLHLVQSVLHADPNNERYQFLRRRAFRITVNPTITDAINATGIVNGPVVTIPIGTDIQRPTDAETGLLPWTAGCRPIDVFVAGKKNPEVALAVAEALRRAGVSVTCVTDNIPRPEFLSYLARSRVVLALPALQEGFFLVPLEAIGHGCVVVCPNGGGVEHYERDVHLFKPQYTIEAILDSVDRALSASADDVEALQAAGADLLHRHDLQREERQFRAVLELFESGW